MATRMGFAPDAAIGCRDFKIGCIGAGFIMADVPSRRLRRGRLPCGRDRLAHAAKAAEVAKRWGIGRVHDTPSS